MAAKGKFALDTNVSPEKSLDEIRALLKRYDAQRFGYLDDGARIMIAFEMRGRRVRFTLPMPTREDGMVGVNQSSVRRFSDAAYDQALRSRWRGLVLTIKAKLESVEVGIETFEEAFMAQLVLPSGQTMAEWAVPQIAAAYQTGTMPPLLTAG